MKPDKIQSKYEESFQYLQLRKTRQSQQLVLLSNLRRGEQNISSTLMITLFDRIMAGVYDDKIQVKFVPSQGITQEQINSYNTLAQSDYQEMGKAQLDYDWCWDTLFFGRGYVETLNFDKKRKIMQPHVINPLNFGYDPYFEKVQDWRYYWKWITKSKWDLQKLQNAGVLKYTKDISKLPSGIDEYLWNYKVRRDQAREGVSPSKDPIGNDVFQILEFFGHDEKTGDKMIYWTDKNFSEILYEQKLDLEDGESIVAPNGKTIETDSKWPIVVKEAFRIPHQSIPISVADLLEDKHRAKAVLLNLAYIAAKDQANPVYLYDPLKIQNASAFLARQVNQHIPVIGDPALAVQPLNKANAMSPDLQAFIQYLDSEAEAPVGAGKPMSEPGGSTAQTATQASLDQQLNDMAQSIQSKVMQFGEQDFWSNWFHRYAKYGPELKEKTANIIGVKGVDTSIISLNDFRADFPPGTLIYSAKEAEYKNMVKRREMAETLPILSQTMEPDGFRNFMKFVYWPLNLEDPSLIDVMFPDTMDEMAAEAENQQLAEDILAEVHETDDHTVHIYTHNMVQPKTNALWLHLDWHKRLLAEQKEQEQKAMQAEMSGNMDQSGSSSGGKPKPKFGKEKKSPQAAATPLKTEMVSDNQKN